MKKLIQMLTIALMLCLLLTACGHKHDFASWNSDPETHWQVCECGEITEKQPHTADSWGYCQVCGLSVSNYEDGTYSVITYDQQGAISSQIDYDADGSVLSEMTCETEYYDNGHPKHQKRYYDGVLEGECFYQPNSQGGMYISKEIVYYGACKYIRTYDENWNLLTYTTCDLDDKVLTEDRYEYQFDSQGNAIQTTCYTDDELSNVSEDMVGPDGEMYNVSNVCYENGKVLYTITNQYQFDDAGHMTVKQEYTDGVLSYEMRYQKGQQDYYLSYEASYDESGNLLRAYHYDANGNIVG